MGTGASVIADTIRRHGVSTVFTLCGDHTNPMLDACTQAGIRLIDARDERGAAWMAAGWALGSGGPGVLIVSNTPALLNAATALADSDASGIPIVCLTGGLELPARGSGHPGDADQVAIAAPWSRSATLVKDTESVGADLSRAFADAMGPPRGVSVLDVPLDVQRAGCESGAGAPILRPTADIEPESLGTARRALASARRPVLIAGEGCYWDGAGAPLHRLVEDIGIPVFTARAARGLIPDEHPGCYGFPNLLAEPAQRAFAVADVAVIAGARLDLTLAGGGFAPDCTVIRIDDDPAAFSLGRAADIVIVGGPTRALAALADGTEPLDTADWHADLSGAVAARGRTLAARAANGGAPMHPGRLMHAVADALPRDAIVTVDAGAFALWAIDAIEANARAGFHASSMSPLGALGMGVPWAIGLGLAQPERRVVALVGDGSFGFTALEVETARRHGVPLTVVVGNDGGWGIVRQLQTDLYGEAVASDLPRSSYRSIAAFAGAIGDEVSTVQEFDIAFTNALAADVPSVIDAHIDPDARHPALDMISAMFGGDATPD